MEITPDIWKRFQEGIIPDDEELRCVIQFLTQTEESLKLLSQFDRAHHLSWVEVSTDLRRANGYADSRGWARLHKLPLDSPEAGILSGTH